MITVRYCELMSRVAFSAAAMCSAFSITGTPTTRFSANPTLVPDLPLARMACTASPWPSTPL
jgi:hypothetical protein